MAFDAQARAQALVHCDAPALDPSDLDRPSNELIALAWAIKDESLDAWTKEPRLTLPCVDLVRALAAATGLAEVAAALSWCEGMRELTLGQMDEAIRCFDSACEALTCLGRLELAPKTQVPKLVALSMLGRHQEAVSVAERAREQFLRAGDELSAGKVELNLGHMLLRQDRYEESARFSRQAASRFARMDDVKHSIMADLNLAGALAWQFAFDEASRLYARSEQRAQVRGWPMLQAIVDSNRGHMELHRGRFELALMHFDAALHAHERSGMPQQLAEARIDLASAYLALNLLPEAIDLYDLAIEACRTLDAPIERAWAKVHRAQALARQGSHAQAMLGLESARELFRSQDNQVGVGVTHWRSAALHLECGDPDPDPAALRRAQQAQAVFAQAGIEIWRCEAAVVTARALLALGSEAQALSLLDDTLKAAEGFPETEAACLCVLAQAAQRRGDRPAARALWEQVARCVELQRASLPGDEFRAAYGTGRQAAFDALIEGAMDDTGADAAPRLLHSIERSSAQALRASLGRRDENAGAGEGVDGARRDQLHWLHGQWQQALTQGELARAAQLQERSRRLEQEFLEQQRRVAAAGGSAVKTRDAVPVSAVDIDALRAALGDDAALVEFAVVGDRLAACIVTRAGVRHVVAPAAGLDQRLQQLQFQINALRIATPALQRHAAQRAERARAHLQALHALVWQPLVPWLREQQALIIVPHRQLHYLPFCALHDGQRYLVERHALSLAPSAAVWLHLRAAIATRPAGALRRVVAFGVGGQALPHVASEVRAVAAAFEAMPGGSALVRQDTEATQAALQAALPGADVLHLACHGQFRADSPYFSALHLADGPLTLRDAAALPLQARLVTLSACETGLSKVAPGDELLGLLRGFLMAGAPAVLATQWTIEDASTAALMQRFYARLLAGHGPAGALRAAQLELMAEHPHPCHWAPFALHGLG